MTINPVLELLEKKAGQTEGVPPRGRNCLAIYLAHKENVEGSLKAGWNLKSIWEVMREGSLFPGSYDTFVRCARQARDMKPVMGPSLRSETLKSSSATVSTLKRAVANTENSGFVYSPDTDIDKLI